MIICTQNRLVRSKTIGLLVEIRCTTDCPTLVHSTIDAKPLVIAVWSADNA